MQNRIHKSSQIYNNNNKKKNELYTYDMYESAAYKCT